ncbi:MAG: prenyltransferase [Prevotellaceae bacterium]|jgi:1,4-dihydroxy-2-naphthoate octaprenyltransferase|nr:prenyltransferase [Prevotellaceae bacterium]
MNGIIKNIATWVVNARWIALPQSVLPALLAIAMAARTDDFSGWMAVIALLGIICAHLGMNLADDYFDYQVKSGEVRTTMASEGMRARIAKYPYLTLGHATVKELRVAIGIFLLLAVICGCVVLFFRGLPTLWLMLTGGFLGISYSGKPFHLSYHGWGEPVIGVMFGPLLMTGIYYASCGQFDIDLALVSVMVGLLVINIVYSHSVLDIEADRKMNKKTFAQILRTDRAQLIGSAVFNFVPFLLMLVGVACGWLHVGFLLVFLLLPMAISLFRSLEQFVHHKEADLTIRFWMGPMGKWDDYCKFGVGWFMFRWLQARNMIMFFCLILILVNLVLEFVRV